MGGKLRIAFLVILAGVFFFPPDGADALKCVCNEMSQFTNFTLKLCPKGDNNKDDAEGETDCPDGVCTKFDVTDTALGSAKDVVGRGCFTTPGQVPHLGCESTKIVTKYTTPENKTMLVRNRCYCNKDLCNSVGQLRGMSWTQLSVSAIFLGVILSRIGGIQ